MSEMAAWARDVLLNRGALVECDETGPMRALLPPEVSAALGAGEWLSLNFGPGPGADDPHEWLERLGALLPDGERISGARLRRWIPVPPVDAEAILDRKLVIQNGVWRLADSSAASATYLWFLFQHTVESDDRSIGAVAVCLNASARSLVPQPETLLRFVRDDLEQDPGFQIPSAELREVYPFAAAVARTEVVRSTAHLVESANRRLARDTQRVQAYYEGAAAQIRKRIARAPDPQRREKEQSRLAATELDRAAKVQDLAGKYALRGRLDLAALLAMTLPVHSLSVRLVRKREERLRVFHWNQLLHLLEPPLCDHCSGPALPLHLCERVHCLCKSCWGPCPRCARTNCPVCRPQCVCGAEVAHG